MFNRHNVKKVITVDPHTTNILRRVYPIFVEDYRLEVQSYLEILAESCLKALHGLDMDLVVHDSCVYARYENVVDQPRELLRNAGAGLPRIEFSGRSTYCCGGPIESLFPTKARTIAKRRLEQLEAAGGHIVTMCPICLVNLREAASGNGVRMADISRHLFSAYCDPKIAPSL
jgi:Fe-S oxidoreductase